MTLTSFGNIWLPIASAPRDGTPILVVELPENPGEEPWIDVVVWHLPDHGTAGWHNRGGYNRMRNCDPTHWMPLPSVCEPILSINMHKADGICGLVANPA